MSRIYHPFNRWEDHKHGFYDSFYKKESKDVINNIVSFFCDEIKCKEYMDRVVDEWVFSCEHNLTNPSINKVAYIGQSAVCLFLGYPNTITMEAWSSVPEESKLIANRLAEEAISRWGVKNA